MKAKLFLVTILMSIALAVATYAGNNPITAHQISISGTSARNTVAFQQARIAMYSDNAFYFKMGDSSVTATTSDHYYPGGSWLTIDRDSRDQYMAIIAASSGTAYLEELK